jgi:hypothetical protein
MNDALRAYCGNGSRQCDAAVMAMRPRLMREVLVDALRREAGFWSERGFLDNPRSFGQPIRR